MRRTTQGASAVAADLGEELELVLLICMDQDVFLTGFVDRRGVEPQLDDDAIEEVKETIAALRQKPNGIGDYMTPEPNTISSGSQQ